MGVIMETINDLGLAFSKFEGRVEAKLDEISGDVKTLNQRVDKRDAENQDLLKRVTTLEATLRVVWAVIGLMGIAGTIVATWLSR